MKEIKNGVNMPKSHTQKNTRFSIDNDVLKGVKFSLGIIFTLIIFLTITYAGSHYASNILGGTFMGNYTFQNNVEINKSLIVNGFNLSPAKTQIIYLNNSMSALEIQEIIDNVPKYIPSGESITFQFKDGEYKLDGRLVFNGFFGGGKINIQGNRSEENATQLHTSQKVFLNFTNLEPYHSGFSISSKLSYFNIYNLKVFANPNDWEGIISLYGSHYLVEYSYIIGNNSYGIGFYCSNDASCDLEYNYLSTLKQGISASKNSRVYSRDNDDYGDLPETALISLSGGIIAKYSTQPEGSLANESVFGGGVIR